MKETAKVLTVVGLVATVVAIFGCLIRTMITGQYGSGPVNPGYYPWMWLAGGGTACLLVGGMIAEASYLSLFLGVSAMTLMVVGYVNEGFVDWVRSTLGVPPLLGYPVIFAAGWILLICANLARNRGAAAD